VKLKEREFMMKKYFLMLVMMFTMSVYSFAEDNNATEMQRIERFTVNVNTKKLGQYLELSKDQMESVEVIAEEFSRDLMFAAVECNDNNRIAVTKNLINKNLQHMSYVLDKEQYKKYMRVLNVTVINRGWLNK
jgi:hypothetical protein